MEPFREIRAAPSAIITSEAETVISPVATTGLLMVILEPDRETVPVT